MKLKYKEYVIDQDKYSFIFSEEKEVENGDNKGEKYLADAIYPSSFESVLMQIFKREVIKYNGDDVIDIEKYLDSLKVINQQIKEDMSEIAKDFEKQKDRLVLDLLDIKNKLKEETGNKEAIKELKELIKKFKFK